MDVSLNFFRCCSATHMTTYMTNFISFDWFSLNWYGVAALIITALLLRQHDHHRHQQQLTNVTQIAVILIM